MNHIILLGDSILDNAAYTADGPPIAAQLQALVGARAKVSLRAIDGSLTTDVLHQLTDLPPDASHLVVSAGGNNAIMQSDVVAAPAATVGAALQHIAHRTAVFEQHYQTMLDALLAQGLPIVLCTVYAPHFADPVIQQVMRTGLIAFNDVIIRTAVHAGVPLIDLRLVCTSAEDYANEIEPSVVGGAKIAAAIDRVIATHNFQQTYTTIYR